MRQHRRARSDVMVRSERGERRGIQIGPRIRIGGTVGKIGQKLKIGTGKVLSNPITQGVIAMTPLGPWGAAAAGSLGDALDTTDGSQSVGDVVTSGAKGYAAGKVGQFVKSGIGNIAKGGIGGIFRGGGADGKGNFGAIGDLAGKIGGSGVGSLVAGGLKGAGGYAGGGGGGGLSLGGFGLNDLVDAGLGTAGLVNAAQLAKKSDQFANTAYGDVRSSYDARAPLRSAGIQGMLNPGAGVPLKLQGVNANAGAGNPFFKRPGGVKL